MKYYRITYYRASVCQYYVVLVWGDRIHGVLLILIYIGISYTFLEDIAQNTDLYIANQDVNTQTQKAYSLRSDVYSFKCCMLIVATFYIYINQLLEDYIYILSISILYISIGMSMSS